METKQSHAIFLFFCSRMAVLLVHTTLLCSSSLLTSLYTLTTICHPTTHPRIHVTTLCVHPILEILKPFSFHTLSDLSIFQCYFLRYDAGVCLVCVCAVVVLVQSLFPRVCFVTFRTGELFGLMHRAHVRFHVPLCN